MSDIVSATVGPSEAGAWLSLEAAARVLGVTVRTVDRRGLPKRRLPGRPTEVWVAGADDTGSDMTETSDGHIRHDDERAIALSERVSDVVGRQMAPLLAELAASRQRIEDLARENGLLTAQLAAASERIAFFTAPQQPVEALGEPEPPAPTSDAPAPWWRRWRAWLAAGLVVVVVGSASCQTSVSLKHPGLCTSARATMDFWVNELTGEPLPSAAPWSSITSAIETAGKVC